MQSLYFGALFHFEVFVFVGFVEMLKATAAGKDRKYNHFSLNTRAISPNKVELNGAGITFCKVQIDAR